MITTSKCKGATKEGALCQAPAQASGYCFWHYPDKREERKAARAKGGRARHGRQVKVNSDPVSLESAAEAVVTMAEFVLAIDKDAKSQALVNVCKHLPDDETEALLEERHQRTA